MSDATPRNVGVLTVPTTREHQLIADGDLSVYLELPDSSRSRRWARGERFSVRCGQWDAGDPVHVMITKATLMPLGDLVRRDAIDLLGPGATVIQLQWWWCDRHDEQHRRDTALGHITREELAFLKRMSPKAWARWRGCLVWRLEWMFDPTDKRRYLTRSTTSNYAASPHGSIDTDIVETISATGEKTTVEKPLEVVPADWQRTHSKERRGAFESERQEAEDTILSDLARLVDKAAGSKGPLSPRMRRELRRVRKLGQTINERNKKA